MSKELTTEISLERMLDICQTIVAEDELFGQKTQTQKVVTVIYLLLMDGNSDHFSRDLLRSIADPEFLNVVDQILEIVGDA